METSGPPEPPSTTRLCTPVNEFFTLLNIVYFAISVLVYLGTKQVSMFFQSERTCTELGDSWADKIRSRIIAFAQDLVATGSNFRTNKQVSQSSK